MLRASVSPAVGQDEPAIFFVFEQALAVEPLHHVGDAGLRDPEAGRDIDDAGVTLAINQLENALEIIFDRGGIARRRWFWPAR